MPRELLNCPEDMLRPTSKAALRSLSACNCSCNLETYMVMHRPKSEYQTTNKHLNAQTRRSEGVLSGFHKKLVEWGALSSVGASEGILVL